MSDENRQALRFSVAWLGGLIAAEFNVLSVLGFIAVALIAWVCAIAYAKLEA